MRELLISGLITCIIGLLLFLKERRKFSVGVILVAGILQLVFGILIGFSQNYVFNIFALIFVFGLIPLSIVAGGIYLIFNGRIMRHKEGRRLANLLSLFLGVYILFIVFLIFLFIAYGYEYNTYINIVLVSIIVTSIYIGFLAFTYLLYSYIYQMAPVRGKVDYIIVLGSGLIGDKVPPLLKSRLDKGIEVYYQQKQKGVNAKLIVSGGQGPDELVSEAEAMKKYLLSQEIPEEDVLAEDKSTTTYENMKFSKRIMDSLSKKYSSIFVTNNYHVFRAAIYARKARLKAQGKGAPTAFYFLPSALIREFIAILVLQKWIHCIIILLLISFIIITSLPI